MKKFGRYLLFAAMGWMLSSSCRSTSSQNVSETKAGNFNIACPDSQPGRWCQVKVRQRSSLSGVPTSNSGEYQSCGHGSDSEAEASLKKICLAEITEPYSKLGYYCDFSQAGFACGYTPPKITKDPRYSAAPPPASGGCFRTVDGPGPTICPGKNQSDCQSYGPTCAWSPGTAEYWAGMDESYFTLSTRFYVDNFPDLKKAFGNDEKALRTHWSINGRNEGRAPSPGFDPMWYLERHPDLKKAFGTNYREAATHWFTFGAKECRAGAPKFNPRSYLDRYPDLQKAFGDDCKAAYSHYLKHGYYEGRDAS